VLDVQNFYPFFKFTASQNLEVCFELNSKAQSNQSTGGANKIKHMSIKFKGYLLLERTFIRILFYSKRYPLRPKRQESKDTSKFNSRRLSYNLEIFVHSGNR
jgi:hypothetical protein